jgi:hypothetical protein
MPAPTFIKYQDIPQCSDNGGISADETDLDRANVDVNTNCCRTFGTNIAIQGAPYGLAAFYEGTVSTCSDTATGMKVYSSDDFRICGGVAFVGNHTGSGTIVGAAFTGTGSGTVTGAVAGSYTLTIAGTFTTPTDGTFSGTLAGTLIGTFTGVVAGGAVTSITYTITTPATSVATGSLNTFTVGGGGTTFTFGGRITATTSPVRAYWRVEFSGCSKGEVLLELLNDSDDSLIADYINNAYCLKSGRVTMLQRRFVECAHPCIDSGLTQGESFLRHPLSLCFRPILTMPMCNSTSIRDKLYTTTVGTSPSTVLSAIEGLSLTHTNGVTNSVPFSGTGAAGSFTANATVTLAGFLDHTHDGTYNNVTVTATFTGSASWSVTVSATPCISTPSGSMSTGRIGFTTPFTAVTAALSGGGIPIPSISQSTSTGFQWSTTHAGTAHPDFCAGTVSMPPTSSVSPIPALTVHDPNFFGAGSSLTAQIFFDAADIAPDLNITQSGTAYP